MHGQAPHSQRPGAQPAHLELRVNKTNTPYNTVSSPNVERKTSLTVDEVKSSRVRTPEYCSDADSGRCRGGICAKKTEVRRWTLSAILVRQLLLPQNEGESQNNVQPLVSPWSWDYTLSCCLRTQAQYGDPLVTLAGWGLRHLHMSHGGRPVLTYLGCANANQSLSVAQANVNYYVKETVRYGEGI